MNTRIATATRAWLRARARVGCIASVLLASSAATAALAGVPAANNCDGGAQPICINELLIEMPGKDSSREYLELRGPPAAVIPEGTWLVAVEGDRNQNPGTIVNAIHLGGLAFGTSDGISAHGFLVLLPFNHGYAPQVNATATQLVSTALGYSGLPDGRWASNGAVNYDRPTTSFFLVQSPTPPTIGFDFDSNDDGVPEADPEAFWSVLDSIASADHQFDRTYARLNYRRSGASAVGATVIANLRVGYFGRFGDSFGSAPGAWVTSAQVAGNNPNWLLSTGLPAGLAGKPLNHIGGINRWENLAPVHALPAAPAAHEDVELVLAAASAISIADVDAGAGSLSTTLTSVNGTLTLATTAGLAVAGDGSASVVASGTLTALNAALDGLRFTPAPDYFGAASISIATDDHGNTGTTGPAADSDTLDFTVESVNDAPSFTIGPNQTAEANSGPRVVDPWATQLSVGPANEAGQTLAFQITANDNPALFAAPPAVSSDGILSFTPAAVADGVANISVTLVDDGGTANSGADTSTPQAFTITIGPDVTLPTLSGSAIEDGDADDQVLVGETLNYAVTFSESMAAASVTAADFDNAGTAAIDIGAIAVVDNVATVAVTPTSAGTVVLRIVGVVQDLSGNALQVPVSDDTTVTALSAVTSTLITSDDPDPSLPGQSYVVVVAVNGESGVPTGSVEVSDDLGASCSITLASGTGSCALASTQAGARTLTAAFTSDVPLYAASSDSEPHAVSLAADVAVTKDNGDSFVERGDPVLYTMTVTNAGTEALAGVRVQDILSSQLANGMWSCAAGAGGTCPVPAAGSGDIDVLVDLAVGGVVTFTLAANVAANASNTFVINQVTATLPSGYIEQTPGNNVAIDVDEVYGIFRNGFEGM